MRNETKSVSLTSKNQRLKIEAHFQAVVQLLLMLVFLPLALGPTGSRIKAYIVKCSAFNRSVIPQVEKCLVDAQSSDARKVELRVRWKA